MVITILQYTAAINYIVSLRADSWRREMILLLLGQNQQ